MQAYSGYGGPAVSRIQGKPGISKGGQTVMLYNVNCQYAKGCIHWHSLGKKDPCVNAEGPNEVFLLRKSESFVHIDREESPFNDDGTCHFFTTYHTPQLTITLPVHGGKRIWMHLYNTTWLAAICHGQEMSKAIWQSDTSSNWLIAACYESPIVAIKRVQSKDTTKTYTQCLISLQSTRTTNITIINALPSWDLYVSTKEKGRGKSKQIWGIENNEARELYLSTYWTVHEGDKLIKFGSIFYSFGNIGTHQWDMG